MNEPYRLRYTNQIVGLFLLVFLLFLLGIAVVLLRTSDVITKSDRYWIQVDQGAIGDLNTGAEVVMLGDRVGQVESIQYVDASGDVRVNLSIERKKSDQIFADSVVILERKYGLGTPILMIRRSVETGVTRPLDPLPSGSQLTNFLGEVDRIEQMAREVQTVSDSVRRIQQRLDPTLDGIDVTARTIGGSFEESFVPAADSFLVTNETILPQAMTTLDTIQAATRALDERLTELTLKIEQLVDNDVRQTLGNVRESTDEVSTAAKTVGQTSEEVNENVAATLETLQDAAEQFQQLALETRELVRVVRREADDLPGTTERVNETLGQTQDLVGEIRGHWLLRNVRRPVEPTSQVAPSTLRGSNR